MSGDDEFQRELDQLLNAPVDFASAHTSKQEAETNVAELYKELEFDGAFHNKLVLSTTLPAKWLLMHKNSTEDKKQQVRHNKMEELNEQLVLTLFRGYFTVSNFRKRNTTLDACNSRSTSAKVFL